MTKAADTLFYTIENDAFLKQGARIAFLGAQMHEGLQSFDADHLTLQKYFKPHADALKARGFTVYPDFLDDIPKSGMGAYDVVLALTPKNVTETRYMLARALQAVRTGGLLVCAADNKAGGARLPKILSEFGLTEHKSETRNKARAVSVVVNAFDESAVMQAITQGEPQPVLEGAFMSQAGVYGWNKVDKGSAILASVLPDDLRGQGADFGCGYGYLSYQMLSQGKHIEALDCFDADWRALQLCKNNLSGFENELSFEWSDLTLPLEKEGVYDFVVMNPPFHEGKTTDITVGLGFIRSAHRALRRKGALWMVANTHLPYERELNALFRKVEKIYEGQGFKVYCATK